MRAPVEKVDVLGWNKSYMTIQQLGHVAHALAFMDSSSSLGWTHKESFGPLNEGVHYMIARWLG